MPNDYATDEEVRGQALAGYNDQERAEYEAAWAEASLAVAIAEEVYHARKAAGLSQAELAARAGTTQPAISLLEGGGRVPTLDTLDRIARALGRSLHIEFQAA